MPSAWTWSDVDPPKLRIANWATWENTTLVYSGSRDDNDWHRPYARRSRMGRRTGESTRSKAELTTLRSRPRSFPPMTSTSILNWKGVDIVTGFLVSMRHTDATSRVRTPTAALRAALASSLSTSKATKEASLPLGVMPVQTCCPSSLAILHYRCCQQCAPPRDDYGDVGRSRGRRMGGGDSDLLR
jgi:hypothetical protein